MQRANYTAIRAACAYFFMCPGICYGILTARMPALKAQTGVNEAQIGLVLLSIGLASLASLFSANWMITKFSSRLVLRVASVITILGLFVACLATNFAFLVVGCVISGLGIGQLDVALNAQAIQLEHVYHRHCMAMMHASYSLGGVLGALTASLFASFALSPFLNALLVLCVYSCARPWAVPKLLRDIAINSKRTQKTSSGKVPFFVLFCGITAAVAYAAEGTVAEWGSLYIHAIKGSSEQVAALVFATFSTAMVCGRLTADGLRGQFSDVLITGLGASCSVLGMCLVLFSAQAFLCLVGYALMGIGLAPIVPILFSRAGSYPGVSVSKATSVVSIMAYSGMLVFPPLLGFVAQAKGLHNALFIALGACCLLVLASVNLRKKRA